MEHPYRTRTPHPLTDQLRQQWLRIRAQNRHLKQLSHQPDPAHVEPNVPSTRNTSFVLQNYNASHILPTITPPVLSILRLEAG
jgi:hypothetical protein